MTSEKGRNALGDLTRQYLISKCSLALKIMIMCVIMASDLPTFTLTYSCYLWKTFV